MSVCTVAAGGLSWVEVPPESLDSHFKALLRVDLADGRRIEGMLVDRIGPRIRLQLAPVDGGGLVTLHLDEVARLSVLSRRP